MKTENLLPFAMKINTLTSEQVEFFKALLSKFIENEGVEMINIKNYISKTSGEVADHLVNIRQSVDKTKAKDLKKLKAANIEDIKAENEISLDTFKEAIKEMIESKERDLNPNFEKRGTRSKAQTEAYEVLCNGIKFNPNTNMISIFGNTVRKTVIVDGVYKSVQSRPKTIAKRVITKALNLRTDKFRHYDIENINEIKISHTQIINEQGIEKTVKVLIFI